MKGERRAWRLLRHIAVGPCTGRCGFSLVMGTNLMSFNPGDNKLLCGLLGSWYAQLHRTKTRYRKLHGYVAVSLEVSYSGRTQNWISDVDRYLQAAEATIPVPKEYLKSGNV